MTQIGAGPSDDGQHQEGEGYTWSQAGEEVEVRVPVPAGTKAKALKVKFSNCALSVAVGADMVLDGKLSGSIDVDECTWTVADDVLEITLTRHDSASWGALFL